MLDTSLCFRRRCVVCREAILRCVSPQHTPPLSASLPCRDFGSVSFHVSQCLKNILGTTLWIIKPDARSFDYVHVSLTGGGKRPQHYSPFFGVWTTPGFHLGEWCNEPSHTRTPYALGQDNVACPQDLHSMIPVNPYENTVSILFSTVV